MHEKAECMGNYPCANSPSFPAHISFAQELPGRLWEGKEVFLTALGALARAPLPEGAPGSALQQAIMNALCDALGMVLYQRFGVFGCVFFRVIFWVFFWGVFLGVCVVSRVCSSTPCRILPQGAARRPTEQQHWQHW